MLYVGIDIAKNKHDLACINEAGEIVITNFRFTNSYQGFKDLLFPFNYKFLTMVFPIVLDKCNVIHVLKCLDFICKTQIFIFTEDFHRQFNQSLANRLSF